jgi:hypothetical protein
VGVVVDAGPGAGVVDGAEDTELAADGAHQVECCPGVMWCSFAEAKGMDFIDAGLTSEV